ncbi:MAG: helix-turn-helix domain-containing protein [Croceitalea sp.]|nr:helix-turn-helix domain-containing protein [Croceitalea sp.]
MGKELISILDLQIVLDAIGFVQGITLGGLLLLLNRQKYRSSFFLGLFLIFFSLELLMYIFIHPDLSELFPQWYLLPFYFSWLLMPLFFIYTQQVSVLSQEKIKYWVLYPGILVFVINVIIFFLPFETKKMLYFNFWHDLLIWQFGTFYSWLIGFWNLRLLYRHKLEIENTYSQLTSKELIWARNLLIYLLATSMISYSLSYIFNSLPNHTVYLAAMDIIAIYLFSYFGIVQRNIRSLLNEDNGMFKLTSKITKANETMVVDKFKDEALMQQINNYIIDSECYTNQNLTIVDLADAMNIHPKRISTAINLIQGRNFNTYINQFRIKKAEKLLLSDMSKNLSIEGIANESGFNSKSAFYMAFKKFNGKTPHQFLTKVKA